MKIATKLTLSITIIALVVTGVTIAVFYKMQQKAIEQSLQMQTKAVADEYIAIRHVIAQNQDRINYDSAGNFEFKALNPARVGNMVAEYFNKLSSFKVKQTSLRYRNPLGAPDDFEREILQRFEKNPEVGTVFRQVNINGKPYYRLMKPIRVKKSCLPCHGEPAGEIDIAGYPKEGYKLGELRGAISVIAPMEAAIENMYNTLKMIGLSGLGLLLLAVLAVQTIVREFVQKPIDKLVDAADRISMGDFDVDVQVKGEELGRLAKAFNRMKNSLKKSMELLQDKL